MCELRPGSELAGYVIEAIEREDAGAAVLRARDRDADRPVVLHVADEPPGSLTTMRFLERAHRVRAVDHPHLLGVYGARTLAGRAVAVAQSPPGRRLDELLAEGPIGPAPAVRIGRQLASAVAALEDAGAEPPPLDGERIWVDGAGDAHLDALDAPGAIALPRAASSAAGVARLVAEMTPHVPPPLEAVLTRALDGAYLSPAQLADALRGYETGAADRRRRTAIAVAVVATLVVAALVLAKLALS
ncbi:MAG TPA: hypothetical protein VFG79_15850 [Solirubrobacter sp.]|nr:hypothetical protein [Solirubrobacter sp.]